MRRTRPLKPGPDGLRRSMITFNAAEAAEIEAAASGLPVATWIRWAALRMARAVNGAADDEEQPK